MTADDLEQPQSVRHFFVAPLIAADYSDPQHFDTLRLNQQRNRLQIAAAGSGAVFVDDDLAPRLAPSQGSGQQQRKSDEPRVSSDATL